MTVSRDVVLNIIADTKRSQENMVKFLGFTEKQARSASVAIFKQQVKDQAKAAKAAKKEAKKAADGWRQAFRVAAADVGKDFVRALASTGVDLARQVSETRSEIVRLNRETAVSADIIAGVGAAAQNSGQKLSDMEDAFQGLPERMLDAASGAGEAAEGFEALGVSVTEGGKLRDINEVLKETVERLQAEENATLRAAKANLVFGDAGVKMMGALGDVRLETFIDHAERFGVSVGPEAAKATLKWNQSIQTLSGTVQHSIGDMADFFDVSDRIQNFTLGWVSLQSVITETVPLMLKAASAGHLLTDSLVFGNDSKGIVEAMEQFGELRGELGGVGDRVSDTITAFIEQRQELVRVAGATKDAAAGWHEFVGPMPGTEKQLREIADAEKEAAEQAKAFADRTKQAAQLVIEANEDVLTASEKVAAAYQAQTLELAALEQQGLDTATADRARMAMSMRLERDLGAIRKEEAEKAAEDAKEAAKIQAQVLEDREKIIKSAREASEAADRAAEQVFESTRQQVRELAFQIADAFGNAADAAAQAMGAIGEGIERRLQASSNRLDRLSDKQQKLRKEARKTENEDAKSQIRLDAKVLGARKKTIRARMREQRKALRQAFAAEKGAALASVAISTAVGVMKAFQLGPIAGAIAGGAIAVTGATQAALIAGQKPPKFHSGLSRSPGFTDGPDEFTATLRSGERVLNERASQNLSDETIDRLNRDEPAEQGPTMLQIVLGGRIIEEVRQAAMAPINGSMSGHAAMGLMSPYKA